MIRKKLNSLFLLTILFTGNAFAQKDKPNFSGTWDFEKKESSMFIAGFEQMGLKNNIFNCSIKMLIEHNEPELTIRQTSSCENSIKANKFLETTETIFRYFTDGRGEVNTTSENQLVESKTEWNGNKVLITIYQINVKSGKKKSKLVKELNLSKDKQKLTEKSFPKDIGLPESFGDSYTKMVFKFSK